MRIDWYSATVKHPFENFTRCVASQFEWAQSETVQPYKRYDRATEWKCGDDRVIRVDYNEELGDALVTASSDNAPRVADYLRDQWPSHSVSRVDDCEDYTGTGVFEQLDALFVNVAVTEGLKLDQAGDWLRETGRTRYVGSKSSSAMVRVYEKGWQQVDEAKKNGSGLPDNFDITRTRVETQVRPQSRDKKAAAKYSCSDVVSYATWTRKAHSLLAGFDLAAPIKETRSRSPHEKKVHHLAKQYGRTLIAELQKQGGSLELLGKALIDTVHEIERNASRAAQIVTRKA